MRVPFDLKKYESITPRPAVFTRSNQPARILDTNISHSCYVVAYETVHGGVETCTAAGTYTASGESHHDLFMELLPYEPTDAEVLAYIHAAILSCWPKWDSLEGYDRETVTLARYALKREHEMKEAK